LTPPADGRSYFGFTFPLGDSVFGDGKRHRPLHLRIDQDTGEEDDVLVGDKVSADRAPFAPVPTIASLRADTCHHSG
jgi:hypothetical protein